MSANDDDAFVYLLDVVAFVLAVAQEGTMLSLLVGWDDDACHVVEEASKAIRQVGIWRGRVAREGEKQKKVGKTIQKEEKNCLCFFCRVIFGTPFLAKKQSFLFLPLFFSGCSVHTSFHFPHCFYYRFYPSFF